MSGPVVHPAADGGAVPHVSRADGTCAVRRISISGFRTVAATELRLAGVTALVGEANAGKSNLLAAIALLGGGGLDEPSVTDVAGGDGFSIDATTSMGVVAVTYDHGEVTRRGSWPIAVLPSALRAGTVVQSSTTADARLAALVTAFREQARHGGSPGSRADGLASALQRCCDLGLSGLLLLIEEPELYLRPQAQRYLYRRLHDFAASGNQVIYSTHASAFLNVARLEELAIVTRNAGTGTSVHQAGVLPASDGFRAMSEFDAERSELFLADVAILVEGRTEKLALPHVFRALGVDIDREGISIVECGGKANLPVFVRLCRATGVPFVVVHDRDAAPGRQAIPSERRLNDLLRTLAGKESVVELAPDFEGSAGLHRHTHKPEQAWQHFRHLTADQVPADLRRIVEMAAAARDRPRGRP